MYPILIATSLIETGCPAAATHHDAGPLVADGGTPAGEPDAGVVLGELDGGVLTACAPDQGARVEWCELGDIAHLDRACTADEINISSQAQLDAFLSSRAASGDDTVLALSVFGDSINDYSGLEKSGLRVVDLELEHVAVPELHFQNLTVLQEVIVSGDDALTSVTFDGVQAWGSLIISGAALSLFAAPLLMHVDEVAIGAPLCFLDLGFAHNNAVCQSLVANDFNCPTGPLDPTDICCD